MSDTKAEDDETCSGHAAPPSLVPRMEVMERFRVTTSAVDGKLSRLSEETAEVYREIAQCILSDGYLSLTDAGRRGGLV